MNLPGKQRGDVTWPLFWVLVIGVAIWYFFFSGSPAPTAQVAQVGVERAKEVGFFAGLGTGALLFLGGGWFVAETAGWFALCIFWALLIIPIGFISVLCERGDPRNYLWWENKHKRERDAIESHEIAVSLICIATLFMLNWGGIPIYSTFLSWPWYIQASTVIGYTIVGIIWGFVRWDDLSAYLHEVRAEALRGVLTKAREVLRSLFTVRRQIRRELNLENDDLIPSHDHEFGSLIREHSKIIENLRHEFLRLDWESQQFTEITDAQITQWMSELEKSYPPEFATWYKAETTYVSEVSVGNYKGQIYLWTVFWPWSMTFRLVRKVITLRILRDLFTFVFNRLRFVYDRIAARHEVKIEMAQRTTETPTPPEDRGGATPQEYVKAVEKQVIG